jgi:threonyl-tRNA synthetase
VQERLRADGLRVELDERGESVGRKIREAELRKVPYMLVVGERERDEQTVSVREHRGGDTGSTTLEKFSQRLQGELYSPALQPQKSQERDA